MEAEWSYTDLSTKVAEKSEFSPSQDPGTTGLISEPGILLGKYVCIQTQRYPGNTWKAFQLWGQACCIRESGYPQMAGRIPRGQEGKELSSRLLLLFVNFIFLPAPSSPWKPWKQRVTLHLSFSLFTRYLMWQNYSLTGQLLLPQFNNFILVKEHAERSQCYWGSQLQRRDSSVLGTWES